MVQKLFRIFSCVLLPIAFFPLISRAQQPSTAVTCPRDKPGIYVQGAGEWQPLSQAAYLKVKAKHAYLSSLSYGAVAAPMVVEYAGPHAAVQLQSSRPVICVSHILSPTPPMLVHLTVKKKIRELDSGTIRAVPLGGSKQAKADSSSLVPTTTEQPENGIVLLRPQADLPPGEYAVMFGAQNLAILDFGISGAH